MPPSEDKVTGDDVDVLDAARIAYLLATNGPDRERARQELLELLAATGGPSRRLPTSGWRRPSPTRCRAPS